LVAAPSAVIIIIIIIIIFSICLDLPLGKKSAKAQKKEEAANVVITFLAGVRGHLHVGQAVQQAADQVHHPFGRTADGGPEDAPGGPRNAGRLHQALQKVWRKKKKEG
jgi:hypothetical protein